MTLRAIARRYASALFDVATAAGRLDPVAADLAAFAGIVRSNEELGRVFDDPAIPSARKTAVLDALLAKAGDVAIEVRRLLALLAEHDRLNLVGAVAAAFADRLRAASREVAADVVTAVPLASDRSAAIAAALSRATGQRVTMTSRVDPSILGGVVARVGSVVFDGSVRRQLERMRETLLADA